MDQLALNIRNSAALYTTKASPRLFFRSFLRNRENFQCRHLSSHKPVQHITIQKKSAEKKKSPLYTYLFVGLSGSLLTALACDATIRRQLEEEYCEWDAEWDREWRSESQKRDTAFQLSHPVRRQQQPSTAVKSKSLKVTTPQQKQSAQSTARAEPVVTQKRQNPSAVASHQREVTDDVGKNDKEVKSHPPLPTVATNAGQNHVSSSSAVRKHTTEAKRTSTLAASPPTEIDMPRTPEQGNNTAIKANGDERASPSGGNKKQQDNTAAVSPATRSNAEKDKVVPAVKKEERSVRQILLIRHGQYKNPRGTNDATQGLTPLGNTQAHSTGKRLAQIMKDKNCVVIRHSTMLRARETANIIGQYFPGVPLDADLGLEEGVPCLPSPASPSFKPPREEMEKDSPRIEAAFRRYFYRPAVSTVKPASNSRDGAQYEVVVCHGNVIRYFYCRALQIPVSAWLRFATFNCGVTWLSVTSDGYVSAREFGSVGHLPPPQITYH
eukprot:Lankesteria_metandrocarpae@DN5200_c0_g1_i1.p1